MGAIIGYDPDTLREIVDEDAAHARLRELAVDEGPAALAERTGLLRMLGRLDEALACADKAVDLADARSDARSLVAARLRRAQVIQFGDGLDQALLEMNACQRDAGAHGWARLEAFASQHRGKVLFELERWDEAREAVALALAIRLQVGAPDEQIHRSRVALQTIQRRIDGSPRDRPSVGATPRVGGIA